MKEDRFIVLHEWMWRALGLVGNDLIVYAMVYGFSQQGEGSYHGSVRALPTWTGLPLNTAIRALQRLTDMGLITKTDWIDDNNQKRCMYQASYGEGCTQNGGVPKTGTGCTQNDEKRVPKMGTPPYIKDNNKDINKSNQSIAGARTREEEVADLKKEFRAKADAVAGTTYTKEMMDAFCDYWTEPYTNPVGKKFVRWQGEKTWDMAARLRTWASRDKQFAAKARPAYERPKLRPAVDLTFDWEEHRRKMHEICGVKDGEDNGYDY